MKINVISTDVVGQPADLLVLPLFVGKARLSGRVNAIDRAVGAAISSAIADGDFKGEPGQVLLLRPGKGLAARRLLLVGLGQPAAFKPDGLRQAMLPAFRAARNCKAKSVSILPPGVAQKEPSLQAQAYAMALGAVLSDYAFDAYRPEKAHRVGRLNIVADAPREVQALREGGVRGGTVGDCINWARDLIVTPAADLRPDGLARAARLLSGRRVRVLEFDHKRLARMGAGGILSVGRGSEVPPRLIVAEYRGATGRAPWTALVGKGVTFDTGGISLKKWEGMEKMKYDMAGAAAMLGTLKAAAALGLPANIVAVVPAVENMVSGTAFRPGDVIRTLSGKTVEVLSTDAEGRLILADAITYARTTYRPAAMIDAATLTGGCTTALGTVAMGLMGNNEALVGQLLAASEASGEKAWQLPLFDEYDEQVKSEIAELKNLGGPEGSTITGGCFLKAFAGDTPWVHLDIANVAWREKERMGYAPGPTGAPVRLLIEYLLREGAR